MQQQHCARERLPGDAWVARTDGLQVCEVERKAPEKNTKRVSNQEYQADPEEPEPTAMQACFRSASLFIAYGNVSRCRGKVHFCPPKTTTKQHSKQCACM